MDVHHQVVLSRKTHRPVHPVRPMLGRELHEAELHSCQAPLLIQRENLLRLLLEGMLVHIHPHPYSFGLSIFHDLLHVDRRHDLTCIGVEVE